MSYKYLAANNSCIASCPVDGNFYKFNKILNNLLKKIILSKDISQRIEVQMIGYVPLAILIVFNAQTFNKLDVPNAIILCLVINI